MRVWALLSAIACFTILGDGFAEGDNQLVATAKEELSHKDSAQLLSRSIFFFYRNFADPRLDDLARAVWDLDRSKYPNLSWELLDQPEYRINYAQLWAQWVRKRRGGEEEVRQIRSYVEPFLSSSNIERRAAAVNFIGSLGDRLDVPLLRQIALEDQLGVALNAVIAIGKIGGPKAREALADIEDKVSDPALRERIKGLSVTK